MTIASVSEGSNFLTYLKKQITNKIENADSTIFEIFKSAERKGSSIVADYARKFIGLNEADGSADKFVNGGNSSLIPWCAAFLQYSIEKSLGKNAPSWYKNIANKWYCPNIDVAATNANAKIPASAAKRGDIVLFDWYGDGARHVGIVDSNKNGKITTIEGNSSDQVKMNTYNANDGRLSFCSVS